ncbi:MAG: hypothetical protein J5I93_26705, partial [Pirellulaceae bacterium]|nr:hypothetical protein [Pirellulaceae bacterium]
MPKNPRSKKSHKSNKPRAASQPGSIRIEPIPPQVTAPLREVVLNVRAPGANGKTYYELVGESDGAMIHDSRGQFRWTPRLQDLGRRRFDVRVTDDDGNQQTASFEVLVQNEPAGETTSEMADNLPPIIDPIDNQSVPVEQPFMYPVSATDPEGEPLTYRLTSGPAFLSIDSGSGMISGRPMAPGTFPVEVEVEDPHGAKTSESFELEVTNDPPTIDEINDQSIPVGQPFSYPVSATDPEGQTLTYRLTSAPAFLSIDSGSGVIDGRPMAPGTFSVEVEVEDPHGAKDDESFELVVTNDPPTIDPINDQSVFVGQPFSYPVSATDPEGQTLTYRLTTAPAFLSIDSGSGMIDGTPMALGSYPVEVEVEDPHGAKDSESFELTVIDDGPLPESFSAPPAGDVESLPVDDGFARMPFSASTTSSESSGGAPPAIEPIADQRVRPGELLELRVRAMDVEGRAPALRLIDAPRGMTLHPTTGQLRWTPAWDTWGCHFVTVRATSGPGNYAETMFAVHVTAERPMLAPLPDDDLHPGRAWVCPVRAHACDTRRLSWSMVAGPAGMHFDQAASQLRWVPGWSQLGPHFITLRVTDPAGQSVERSCLLQVRNQPPRLPRLAPRVVAAGQTLQLTVRAVDPDGDPVQYELVAGPA